MKTTEPMPPPIAMPSWWPGAWLPQRQLAGTAWLASRADGARGVVKRGGVPAALADVRGPHVARLLDAGAAWHALAWLDGTPLDAQMARGAVPPPIALRWMDDLLAGLDAVHRAGLVHRDVKPANLVLTDAGPLALIDFGLACRAGRCAAQGTPASTAPEQWRGYVTSRSDLFAAGVLLHRLLSGSHPFPGTPFEALQAIAAGRIAALPPALAPYDDVVCRALAPDPEARFADAASFRAALRRVAAASTPA
jgi:serine/threonine protein kinase